jgi:hypothetical protein
LHVSSGQELSEGKLREHRRYPVIPSGSGEASGSLGWLLGTALFSIAIGNWRRI